MRATEIGQGSDDVLVATIAEILGIDPLDIRCVTGDTDLTPVDLGSYSSRVTLMMGNAAIQAAERARVLIAQAVAQKFAVDIESIAFNGGQVHVNGHPEQAPVVPKSAGLRGGNARFPGHDRLLYAAGPSRKIQGRGVGPSPAYSYTAAVVEVEVDTDTGWLTVPRIYIAHDLGRAMNPVLARGQVEGSVYMGLGEALMEESAFRRLPPRLSAALVHREPSMLEYKSPTSLDMPELITDLIEHPDDNGPFGAKEAGQGPLLPIMPALANAVYDAVGVRIDEVPISAEKILKALDDKARGGAGRVGRTGSRTSNGRNRFRCRHPGRAVMATP